MFWVYEFERAIMTRLTVAPGVDNYPAWSPDGRLVAFTTGRGGPRSLFLTDAAASALGLAAIGMAHEEEYPDVGHIDGRVVELSARRD